MEEWIEIENNNNYLGKVKSKKTGRILKSANNGVI